MPITLDTKRQKIEELLESGNEKLAGGDSSAEEDYLEALKLSEELKDANLTERVTKRRENARFVDELKKKYHAAQSAQRKLILLKQLQNAGISWIDKDHEISSIYTELLEEHRDFLLRQSRLKIREDDINGAYSFLEENTTFKKVISPENNNIIEQIRHELLNDILKNEIAEYKVRLDSVVAAPEIPVASEPVFQPPEQLSARDESVRRSDALVAQATSRLVRKSAQNFKEALALLTQASTLNGIGVTRLDRIRAQITMVERDYEKFRQDFGELITARQLDRVEEEIIVIRQLIVAGHTEGPDGEDLAEKLGSLGGALRAQIMRVASERVSLAERNLDDGRDYLDNGPLQAAVDRIGSAINMLRGHEIGGSDEQRPERLIAIEMMRSDLQRHSEIAPRIKDYEERRDGIERILQLVERALPVYHDAEQLYNDKKYRQALTQVVALRGLVRDRLDSYLINTLEQRTQEARAAELRAELTVLRERAQTALVHDDIAVIQNVHEQAVQLDPQFSDVQLDALREQIRAMLDQARNREQEISTMLALIPSQISSGELNKAESTCRAVLLKRPNQTVARKLLDDILFSRVDSTLRKAEQNINSAPNELLLSLRNELSGVRGHLSELDDAALNRQLTERFEETYSALGKKIEWQRQSSERAKLFAEAITETERFIRLEQFSEASSWLEVTRKHALGQEARIARIETDLRVTWIAFLQRRLRQHLNAEPPQYEAALMVGQEIEQRGFANQTTNELYRRAEQLRNRDEAIKATYRGDFTEAVRLFNAADIDNPDTLQLLRDTRRREVEYLVDLQQWDDALNALREVGSSEDWLLITLRRVRGELALRRANEALRIKDFTESERALDEVFQQQISDIEQRGQTIRKELVQKRDVFVRIDQQVEVARTSMRRFEASQSRDELLKAINLLDKILDSADLPAGDLQRNNIQALRNEYQQRYQAALTNERQRLLNQGFESLKGDKISDVSNAKARFQELLGITPGGDDPEAREGIARVRRRLEELRTKQIDEVRQMLNLGNAGQRGVRPNDLTARIEQIEALRQVEPDFVDVALNENLGFLEEARRLCVQAEESLNTARQRWVALRLSALSGESIDTKEIDGSFEHGAGLFARRTYIHIELDRTSIESLPTRFMRDIADLREARQLQEEFRQLFEQQPHNIPALVVCIERLRSIEERLYKTTLKMIEHDRISLVTQPTTAAERYPRQTEIVRRISDQIETHWRNELTTSQIMQLRETMVRRTHLEGLLQRLERDGKTKSSRSENNTFSLEELDVWDKAFQDGQHRLTAAITAEQAAQKDEARKLLRSAAEGYDLAATQYREADHVLKIPVSLTYEHAAIQALRQQAQANYAQVQDRLNEFAHHDPADRCRKLQSRANQLISEAEAARTRNDAADTRSKAEEACVIDPTLSERAEELVRSIDEGTTASGRSGLIVAGVLILGLIILAVVFGPGIWAWVSELLFPTL